MKHHSLALLLGIILASASLGAQTPYTNTFSMDKVTPNAHGWSYWFIPTGSVADTMDLKMSCVTSGDALHGAHIHNHDELFIVVEGKAICEINGEEVALNVGDGLYCPSGSSHAIRRADLDHQIRYLMINRNTKGGIKTPYPFWKESYTAADCFTAAKKNKSYWYVTAEQTLGTLNVRSTFVKNKKTVKYGPSDHQLAIMILEGTAEITVDGKSLTLSAMSVCYLPKWSACTVRAVNGPLRYLESRTEPTQ